MSDDAYLRALEADNDRLRLRVEELEREVARLSASAEFALMTPVAEFGLTTSESKVFARIAASGFATTEQVYETIASGKARKPTTKVVDVYICKLRAKLDRFDIVIETAYGRGYKIGPESMAKIAAIQAGTHIAQAC